MEIQNEERPPPLTRHPPNDSDVALEGLDLLHINGPTLGPESGIKTSLSKPMEIKANEEGSVPSLKVTCEDESFDDPHLPEEHEAWNLNSREGAGGEKNLRMDGDEEAGNHTVLAGEEVGSGGGAIGVAAKRKRNKKKPKSQRGLVGILVL